MPLYGEQIRQERERQQIPREELAAWLGKSPSLLGKWERGVREVNLSDLARIAEFLGRSPEFFLHGAGVPEAERKLEELIQATELDLRYAAELRRTRLRTKEAILGFVEATESKRYGLLRDLSYEVELDVDLDGGHRRWEHRQIEVIDRKVPVLRCLDILARRREGDWISEHFSYRILEDQCSGGHSVKKGNVLVKGNRVLFEILFDPPLVKGEVVDICYEISYPDTYIMTRERVERLEKSGDYLAVPGRESTGMTVFVPMDFLRRRLTFAPGYKVSDVEAAVTVLEMPLLEENDRLKNSGCLKTRRMLGRQVLEMTIEKPLTGATYRAMWLPPSREEYEKLFQREAGDQGKK